jgi:hypothetical protein
MGDCHIDSINKVRASTFSRTELLAYRTKPCYIGMPKKSSFHQKIFGLPKVREKVRFVKKSIRVLYFGLKKQGKFEIRQWLENKDQLI